jgi:hypothetical protein
MSAAPSVPGLVSAAETCQRQLYLAAASSQPDMAALAEFIQQQCDFLENKLSDHHIRVGNLPTRSRQAALWLLFLNHPAHLRQHVTFLSSLRQVLPSLPIVGGHVALKAGLSSYLYRLERRQGGFTLTVQEGFISAPPDIIAQLASLAGRKTINPKTRAALLTYSRSAAYRAIQQTIQKNAHAVYYEPDACGRFHDLKDSFERVNGLYFEGKQSLPHLCWSSHLTRRKLGHYNPVTDSIQISRSLDTARTPAYALDYVMHHEIIHRFLGSQEKNGRQSSHNAAFHKLESAYQDIQRAKEYLATKK